MKLVANLILALAIAGLCLYLAWPSGADRAQIRHAFAVTPYVRTFLPFFALMAVTMLFRAWRYDYLLRPLGVHVPLGRLMAVSGVGFMAVFCLPVRLGELVRPYFVTEKGRLSLTQAVGAVAVERIADGLVISLLVFVVFLVRSLEPAAPTWIMPVAALSLGLFLFATAFLHIAHRQVERAIRLAVTCSVVGLVSPRAAAFVGDKVRKLTSGFRAIHDGRNLTWFFVQTVVYWAVNGLATWWIAYGMGLPLSVVGAFAMMGLVGVAIILPNAPGNVGQFELAGYWALSLYLPAGLLEGGGRAYVLLLHVGQAAFYIGAGLLCLLSKHASLVRAIRESRATKESLGQVA